MGAKRDFSCCILHTPLRDKSDIWNRLGAESSVNWFRKEHISQNWYPKFEQFDWLISKLILLWPNQNTFKFGKLVFYEINEQMILPPRYIRSKKKSKQKKHQQRRSTWRVLNRRITLNFKIIATSFLDDVIMLPWKLQDTDRAGGGGGAVFEASMTIRILNMWLFSTLKNGMGKLNYFAWYFKKQFNEL